MSVPFVVSRCLVLSQACLKHWSMQCTECLIILVQWLVYILWILAEVAICATDLAEIIGSATALNLLFNIPLWAGVLITAVDVLLIIAFGMNNFRVLEVICIPCHFNLSLSCMLAECVSR